MKLLGRVVWFQWPVYRERYECGHSLLIYAYLMTTGRWNPYRKWNLLTGKLLAGARLTIPALQLQVWLKRSRSEQG